MSELYKVLEVIEECDWEQPKATLEERIARSAEGFDPASFGIGSIFEGRGVAKT